MTDYPNWFVESNVVAIFDDILKPFKGKPISALQVGAYTGDASKWMFENLLTNPDSTLVDVDTWAGSKEEQVHQLFDWDEIENIYDAKVKPWKNRLTKIKSTSDEYFKTDVGTFDFIYVDGNHEAASVLKDAVHSFDCLKPGGILAFDDFEWSMDTMPPHLIPRTAIEAFGYVYQNNFKVLYSGVQLWIKKN